MWNVLSQGNKKKLNSERSSTERGGLQSDTTKIMKNQKEIFFRTAVNINLTLKVY